MFGNQIKTAHFASLISPSEYPAFNTDFHHQMKHLEVRQKYSAVRCIFNSSLAVSSGDDTLHLMLDILLEIPFGGRLVNKILAP